MMILSVGKCKSRFMVRIEPNVNNLIKNGKNISYEKSFGMNRYETKNGVRDWNIGRLN